MLHYTVRHESQDIFMQFNHQTFFGFVRKWNLGARLVAQTNRVHML